jgi:hypothetical protein
MGIVVVVGNPKPASRTLAADVLVAEQLGGAPPETVVDVVELGAGLLGWVEAGATCPTKGLFVTDTAYDDPEAIEPWLAVARPQVLASLGRTPRPPTS